MKPATVAEFRPFFERLETALIDANPDALLSVQLDAHEQVKAQTSIPRRQFFEWVYRSAFCARKGINYRLAGDVQVAVAFEADLSKYEGYARESLSQLEAEAS